MKKLVRTSTQTTYEVNGVRYQRLEDIPQEYRKLFEDKDGNGIPDSIESFTDGPQSVMRIAQHRIDKTALDGDSEMIDLLGQVRGDQKNQPRTLKCSNCGFDLREAKVGGQCPECGQQVTQSIRSRISAPESSSFLELLFDHPRLIGTLALLAMLIAYFLYAFMKAGF